MRAVGTIAAVALAGMALLLAASGWGTDAGGEGGQSAGAPEIVSQVAGRPARTTAGKKACTAPDEPANFRLYSLGARFAELPLTTVMRICSVPQPLSAEAEELPPTWRANFVSYIYGTCEPPQGEGGCAPPVEVQVWPACERHRALYRPPPKLTRRRGVPSVVASAVTTEIYTADATVAVSARDANLLERAIAALQPVAPAGAPADLPPRLQPTAQLPPPEPGAVTGDLSCLS